MCWDAKTSIITFILGTIVNISVALYYKKPEITIFCLCWQWAIMMQLSEYLIWIDQDCGETNKLGTKMALIFNLTQPIIPFILLMMFTDQPDSSKIIASVLILVYISYLFLKLNNGKEYNCIKPSTNCSHLNLKWWDDFTGGGYLYTFVLVAILLLLFRPLGLSLFVIAYILITVLLSMIFYSCGAPSIWCWFAVPLPIFVAIFYKYFC